LANCIRRIHRSLPQKMHSMKYLDNLWIKVVVGGPQVKQLSHT